MNKIINKWRQGCKSVFIYLKKGYKPKTIAIIKVTLLSTMNKSQIFFFNTTGSFFSLISLFMKCHVLWRGSRSPARENNAEGADFCATQWAPAVFSRKEPVFPQSVSADWGRVESAGTISYLRAIDWQKHTESLWWLDEYLIRFGSDVTVWL